MTEPVVNGQESTPVGASPPRPGGDPSERPPAGEAPGPTESSDSRSRRRRGSRGGRSRTRAAAGGEESGDSSTGSGSGSGSSTGAPSSNGKGTGIAAGPDGDGSASSSRTKSRRVARKAANGEPTEPTESGQRATPDEPADRAGEGRTLSADATDAADQAPVRKPRIGDTRPAPADTPPAGMDPADAKAKITRRRRGGRGRGSGGTEGGADATGSAGSGGAAAGGAPGRSRGAGRSRTVSRAVKNVKPIEATMPDEPLELNESDMQRRRGRERKGRPVGRYLMCVSVSPKATQIAVLEGRNLIEHYVARPADDISQIHGNIYLGKVQNVLPGMEAAFIDIGTPKNAVLYRGDVQYDPDDVEEKGGNARIEHILRARQTIICQVTKNPIAHKGARLTQEVSLPGRFVVLIPNSTTYGISKRLAEEERKRLRNVLDKVRPKGHGLIVRTAAEGVTAEEIERDVLALANQWQQIEALAKKTSAPALLYREPDMAVRVIREELSQNYRGIFIDDPALYEEVRSYVNAISPALVERVQHYDRSVEPLSIFERHHVHEQLHRALDKKVWLPSGGSLIVEHTEALTVIDVNTGKNVGSSNLEETVYRNNLEAAEEIAKQLRLRDIGGIIVIDFIDMEIEHNRRVVIKAFRDALARDKTRTQVFDISELGLVEMTRKRIGEGLLESLTTTCPECEGRGLLVDQDLMI